MVAGFTTLERGFFRRLNNVVEPAVRRGIASPGFLPAALIVLETTGFKSGTRRRTPLMSVKVGPYRLVSTVRGGRSFWVRNLVEQPRVRYFLAGKPRQACALAVSDGEVLTPVELENLPILRALLGFLKLRSKRGMEFAVLLDE